MSRNEIETALQQVLGIHYCTPDREPGWHTHLQHLQRQKCSAESITLRVDEPNFHYYTLDNNNSKVSQHASCNWK